MADSAKVDVKSVPENVLSDTEVHQNKELREDLIATAVKFLQNPKVRESPLAQRKAFLERKGLNKAEIDLAVYRSGTASDEQYALSALDSTATIARPVHHSDAEQDLAVSGWTRIKHTTSTVVVLGAAAYAVYQLYDKYLAPMWGQKKKSDDYVNSMDELRKSVTEMTAGIKETQSLIQKQQRTLEDLIRTSSFQRSPEEIGRLGVSEVKDEIRSLKALLLNKNQFPAVPTTTPVIPSWQLQQGHFDNVAKSAESAKEESAKIESENNQATVKSHSDSAVNGVVNEETTTVKTSCSDLISGDHLNGSEQLAAN